MESEPYNLSDTLKTARSKNTLKGKDRDIQRKLAGKLYMNKISMFETNEEEDQRWMLNQKHPWNQSMLIHEIYFQDNIYKEIEYLRKYTWESLIGNVGGVIGRYKQESSKHI